MKVLKFGGTSVGSAKNINKVIDIVSNISKETNVTVVVSAVGGITDKLLGVASKAINKDETYKEDLADIKTIHFDIIKALISNNYKKVSEVISERFNQLERLFDGIYLINEMSPKTTDKILSFGELMSSFIIVEAMKENDLDVQLINSQDVIVTNSVFTNAAVNFKKTNTNIDSIFKNNTTAITLFPGFISKSE